MAIAISIAIIYTCFHAQLERIIVIAELLTYLENDTTIYNARDSPHWGVELRGQVEQANGCGFMGSQLAQVTKFSPKIPFSFVYFFPKTRK